MKIATVSNDNEPLRVSRQPLLLHLPSDVDHALRAHARFQNAKPETIAAEALREWLGLSQ